MDHSRRLILILGPCATGLMGSESDQDPPPLSDQAAAVIDAAYRTWTQLGLQVWPGWTGTPAPFVYVDSEWEYGMHFPKELKGFVQQGTHPRLLTSVQARRRTFAPDISASMGVEGVPAVAFGTPAATQRSPAQWELTIQPEMFHVFQDSNDADEKVRALKLGPKDDASWHLQFPFPYKEPEVMRLIHLQGYLAYLGVSSQSEDDARYAAGSALEATQVYRAYLKKIDPDGRFYRYSQFQEWTEGVAFFVEYQMAKLAAQTGEQYRQAWDSDYSARLFLVKHSGRAAKSRTAFYHLGMGKALLLDRLKPTWKQDYFQRNIWMDDLLESALRVGQGRF